MCLLCIETAKGKMKISEVRSAAFELIMFNRENEDHYHQILEIIRNQDEVTPDTIRLIKELIQKESEK